MSSTVVHFELSRRMDIRNGTVLPGPGGVDLTVGEEIGHGGLGQVFAASAGGAMYAVKTVLTGGMNDTELHALQNEAARAVGIDHPNVVRVLHFENGATSAGIPPYLVMEYVEGGTLQDQIDDHLANSTMFSIDELREMFRQIASGMSAVGAVMVHRDLKPENVLFDRVSGQLKIADFGLAKAIGAATRSNTFKGGGTYPYMAPEAFDLDTNTMALDIYGAGAMFYQMATLHLPCIPTVGAAGYMAWRTAHLLLPPRPRTLRNDLPPAIEQMILRMLEKNPMKRQANWSDVQNDIAKAGSAGAGAGTPNVSMLLAKSTATLAETTAREAAELREHDRQEQRRIALTTAFEMVIDVVITLVETFNAQTVVGNLKLTRSGPLAIEVTSQLGRRMRLIGSALSDDLVTISGRARLLAVAVLEPPPRPRSPIDEAADRDSFGGFNLAYSVNSEADVFGDWTLYRFEMRPALGEPAFPRWFAIEQSEDLKRQLQILGAIGRYQYESTGLADDWFLLLLAQLL